jgi:hypothetical protein
LTGDYTWTDAMPDEPTRLRELRLDRMPPVPADIRHAA